jgi:hypothetical protein
VPARCTRVDQLLEVRQVLGRDEAELFEERMARRQIGEQFHHGDGDLLAKGDEVVGDVGGRQHAGEMRVAGQCLGGEVEASAVPKSTFSATVMLRL